MLPELSDETVGHQSSLGPELSDGRVLQKKILYLVLSFDEADVSSSDREVSYSELHELT